MLLFSHTNKNRQVPQRGDVQRLEAHAFLQRAVAEEDRGHRAVSALAAGIAAANAERDAAADDAGGRKKAEIGVAQVNGAAAAAVEAGGAAENLGQGAAGVGPARQHVAMIAVGGRDMVARVEQRHDGGAGRLLPDIEMVVADELFLVGEPQHGLLEPAYQQHRFEHAPCVLVGQGRDMAVPHLHRGFTACDTVVVRRRSSSLPANRSATQSTKTLSLLLRCAFGGYTT